jgi:competence protein ComEC
VGAVRRFLISLSLTSLVAGSATAPFAAYHFNRVSLVGFVANLIAMPVFSTVAMPAAAIAGALAPFGLEGVPAWISARGIDVVIAVGTMAAAHPAAQSGAAAAPPIALALAACALVAGSIVTRGRWRLAGALALAAALAWRAPAGDLWIGESGGWLARVDTPDGVEWVGDIGRGDNYGATLYARRGGAEGLELTAPAASPAFACDRSGCVASIDGKVVVIADAWSSVIEDCARADVVLTPGRAPPRIVARCPQTQLIPRRGRGDRGAVVDLKADEPQLLSARGETRPWRPAAGR